ncbi:MAG: hypothetical protein R3C15_15825, partial [Thermoleophilia bacterium]
EGCLEARLFQSAAWFVEILMNGDELVSESACMCFDALALHGGADERFAVAAADSGHADVTVKAHV